ncbi:hypothetical protein [Paenibacillus sp.]|uniref:hypothetical protein n=1 Tax=Paenibacillus sp. TaxID=58172 RepID=UPI002D4C17C3|nr:hypothetical protein [Paenibacillus sp.]HZG87834.1 hypothetical protein [Paenibacillus sp.]
MRINKKVFNYSNLEKILFNIDSNTEAYKSLIAESNYIKTVYEKLPLNELKIILTHINAGIEDAKNVDKVFTLAAIGVSLFIAISSLLNILNTTISFFYLLFSTGVMMSVLMFSNKFIKRIKEFSYLKEIIQLVINEKIMYEDSKMALKSDNTVFTHRAGTLGRRRGFEEAVAATTPYRSS